jgi:hypothetical protein
MYFNYDEVAGYTVVSAETDDICVMCKHFDFCPFIGALENNIVYPSCDKLWIEDCPIYEQELGDTVSLN